jgi:hypothetical protein
MSLDRRSDKMIAERNKSSLRIFFSQSEVKGMKIIVVLTKEEQKRLKNLAEQVCKLGRQRDIFPEPLSCQVDDEKIWQGLIGQILVRGGARPLESLPSERKRELQEQTRLSKLLGEPDPYSFLKNLLAKCPRPTRFPERAAEAIVELLSNDKVVNRNECRIVLLDGIDKQRQSPQEIRRLLMQRTGFGPKPVSDLMIVLGISHDVIAFDTRIVNTLVKWGVFSDWERDRLKNIVQECEPIYTALEAEIRKVLAEFPSMNCCDIKHMCLAFFDRVIFRCYEELKRMAN